MASLRSTCFNGNVSFSNFQTVRKQWRRWCLSECDHQQHFRPMLDMKISVKQPGVGLEMCVLRGAPGARPSSR
ncbi:hypothetical protein LEMLEM_LOCUS27352, partial [Lemmus lemmus]